MSIRSNSLSEVPTQLWSSLADRSVFFGHQSVGRDILAGLGRLLERHPRIAVRHIVSDEPNSVPGPALVTTRMGRNREPRSKAEAFLTVMRGGFGARPGAVALYKYCYVDIRPGVEPERLFSEYVADMERLQDEFPGLTLGHVTIPLHVAPGGVLERVATAAGQPTQTALNRLRERFNDLLRERYPDATFDLALLESIGKNGSEAASRAGRYRVRMLSPEWTTDGGHLNDEAKDRMAEAFLIYLARLVESTGDAGSNRSRGWEAPPFEHQQQPE